MPVNPWRMIRIVWNKVLPGILILFAGTQHNIYLQPGFALKTHISIEKQLLFAASRYICPFCLIITPTLMHWCMCIVKALLWFSDKDNWISFSHNMLSTSLLRWSCAPLRLLHTPHEGWKILINSAVQYWCGAFFFLCFCCVLSRTFSIS